MIKEYQDDVECHPDLVKFKYLVSDEVYDNLISYSQALEYLSEDGATDDTLWKFRRIISHRGPLTSKDPGYKHSKYNLMIEWEDGSTTEEGLQAMIIDDKMSCYEYGKLVHGLLEEDGWKRLKKCAHSVEQMCQKVFNATTVYSTKFEPSIQFGIQVPRNHEEAMKLDEKNGNTKWKDAIHTELSSIISFDAFKDRGHHTKAKIPSGYKKITVHLVFAAKHDGRHKARLVARGHLTDNPIESVYSSVVSLWGVRMVTFIAELNGLKVWSTDVGNVYLESYTQEKVYIIGGPKFEPFGWQDHVLLIDRALY
jgi:Reverse transcriptase (RNA-dependent DNA polymerase)